MLLIGLVLLAAAAAVGIDIAAENNFTVDVDVFGHTFESSAAQIMVAGVVIGLVAALGLLLLVHGTTRMRRIRRETRATTAERDRLAAAYVQEHRTAPHVDPADVDGDEIDLRDRIRAREEARDDETETRSDTRYDRDHITTF